MSSLPPLPARVGPYGVRRLIAHGGQSVVYEVEDPDTGTAMAAKVLLHSGVSSRRLGREYRALTRVDHPNVVRVLKHGLTEDGQPYLVMELLEGMNAQARVKSLGRPGHPARLQEAVRIAADVADALAYLHARGIIHRDLKSANVVVLADGRVKLLDFGAVRILHGPDAPSDGTEFVGTFHYAAPEQILGRPVDGRTDLYALGVLLYRMLSARRPFEGDSPAAIARLHLHEPPPPLEPLVPGIPSELAALVYQLLEKDLPRRPASAADVAARLRLLLPAPSRDPAPAARPSPASPARRAIAEALATPGFTATLFVGPEGSGRRRLLRRAAMEAERAGREVRRLDLLDTPDPWQAALRRRPDLAPGPPRPPGEAPSVEEVERLLGGGAPGAVVVVQGLADGDPGDTERVLAALARLAAARAPLTVFAAGGTVHADAWTFGRRIPLDPLDLDAVASLARRVRGVNGVAPEEVRRLAAWSDGRVSRLEALLRQPAEDPTGTRVEPVLPADLLTRTLLRLDALEPPDRWVADALAVLDGAAGTATVARALGRSPLEVAASLRRLDAAGLLWMDGDRPRLGGALEALAARRALRPVRAAFLARRLASALGPVPGTERVVDLRLAAGDLAGATRAATEWARGRLAAGLGADAAPRLGRLARTSGLPPDPAFWLTTAEVLLQAEPDRTQVDHAVQRAGRSSTDPRVTAEAEHLQALAELARGETDAAEVRLERVRGRWTRLGDHSRLAGVSRALAELLRRRGHLDAAEAEARRAVELATEASRPRCLGTLASVWLDAGRLVAAERTFRELLPVIEASGRGGWQERVRHAEALWALGRWSEARDALHASLRLARARGSSFALTSLALATADVELGLGRADQARALVEEARAVSAAYLPPALDEPMVRVRVRLAEATSAGGAVMLLAGAVDRARSRGWELAAARLQALRGAVLQRAGRASGLQDTEAARDTLVRLGAWTSLAQALDERADRGVARDPRAVYGPLDAWLAAEPALATRWERAALALAWSRASGGPSAKGPYRRARDAFAAALHVDDRAVLDRHPLLAEAANR